MATVKDLTAALAIGKEQGKQEALVAKQEGGNRFEDMTGYGKNWPGTMKDQGLGDEPGKDPAEMIQLELPLDLVNKLKIMADENPEIAQGIADGLKISSENEDDYAPGSKKHPQTPGKPWQIAGGPDYIGDKRTYGKLDRILNPLNDFKKPTLDQLRIHAANYPKA